MRVLVIIIAILALIGGLIHIVGGMALVFSAIAVITSTSNLPAEQYNQLPHNPITVGLMMIGISILMLINGALFTMFSIGTFMWKKWARVLGIFSYVLNLVVVAAMYLTGNLQGELSWVFGSVLAILFTIILILGKSAFEKPTSR